MMEPRLLQALPSHWSQHGTPGVPGFRPVHDRPVSRTLSYFLDDQDSTYNLDDASDDNEPDNNPSDAFHRVVVEVIMDSIQLFRRTVSSMRS